MDQICAKTVKIISRGLEAKKDQIFTWFHALITNFSKSFWIWTLKCQNRPILAKIGPNLGPNSQNQIKWPRKQSKTSIPHLVQPWSLIFHKIMELEFYMIKISQKWAKFGQKYQISANWDTFRSKQDPISRYFQAMSTNFFYYFTVWNWKFKIVLYGQPGQILGLKSQNCIRRA